MVTYLLAKARPILRAPDREGSVTGRFWCFAIPWVVGYNLIERPHRRISVLKRRVIFEHVLVLNASFEPLNVINWKRAMKLVFLGKVEVLEESDRLVHSSRLSVRVPAVIRLVRFVRFRRWDVKFSRVNIYARDRHRCQYCGVELSAKELTCDHVVPRSQGGTTEWTNIVTCCGRCNRKKGDKTPAQAGLRLLKNPTRPSWLIGFRTRFASKEPPAQWRDYLFGMGRLS
jgi:5-methylcytosine-specific restriction endonuclease McrA